MGIKKMRVIQAAILLLSMNASASEEWTVIGSDNPLWKDTNVLTGIKDVSDDEKFYQWVQAQFAQPSRQDIEQVGKMEGRPVDIDMIGFIKGEILLFDFFCNRSQYSDKTKKFIEQAYMKRYGL